MQKPTTTSHTPPDQPLAAADLHKRTHRRLALRPGAALLVLSCAAAFPSQSEAAVYISGSPGLIAPSFRDGTNTDAGSTTFFGWGPAAGWGTGGNFKFDGATDNERVDNPAALQGIGGLTGTLNQVGNNDIISSGNDIYTLFNVATTLSLEIPTVGTPGDGFTTIILQGHTAFDAFAPSALSFPELGGDAPEFVLGTNSSGQGQFWLKYEIIGNEPTYDLDFVLGQHVSLSELQVDTQWSATSFTLDAVEASPVPEPASASVIMALACCGVAGSRRMRQRKA